MIEQQDKSLETRAADREFLKDVFIPGRFSKRLVKDVNPKTEVQLYFGLAITGFATQAIFYSPAIYGIYKTLETVF